MSKNDNTSASAIKSELLKNRISAAGIGLACIAFASGYPLLKLVTGVPTFPLLTIRFLSAVTLLAAVSIRRFHLLNLRLIREAFLMSLFVFMMYLTTTIGIRYTSASNCSFFSGISALMLPFIGFILFRTKIASKSVFFAILCTVGIFLLSFGFYMTFSINRGDLLCLGCSLFAALQILFAARSVKNHDPLLLVTVQMVFLTFLALTGVLVSRQSFGLVGIRNFLLIALLGTVSSAVGFGLQLICLRRVQTDRASLIFSAQPVIGALLSMAIVGEQIGLAGWIGGSVVMVSIVGSEISSRQK
ncbi:MAG: DMT family transporter [Eubacteriales bacterium]